MKTISIEFSAESILKTFVTDNVLNILSENISDYGLKLLAFQRFDIPVNYLQPGQIVAFNNTYKCGNTDAQWVTPLCKVIEVNPLQEYGAEVEVRYLTKGNLCHEKRYIESIFKERKDSILDIKDLTAEQIKFLRFQD